MGKTFEAPLTIDDCKTLLPGVSERALREAINRIGCASKIGSQYFLELEDFKQLMKECKVCPSNSSKEKTASGTSAGLLTANATDKALELIKKKSQKLYLQKHKVKSKKRLSTEQNVKPHLQMQQSNT